MIEQTISIERMEEIVNLFGSFDENIRLLEKEYDVSIVCRDEHLKICGEPEPVLRAQQAVQALLNLVAKGEQITPQNVNYVLSLLRDGQEDKLDQMGGGVICVTAKGKPIKAKTAGQQAYVDCMEHNTVTLGIGPAGTGKTYLAVAKAVVAFREKAINRIILTRPAVEAGEKLGFLPGDLQNKVDPYLRPLYDALFDMLGPESYPAISGAGQHRSGAAGLYAWPDAGRLLLSFWTRPRTPRREQMKMFLTRLGFNSKVVITGDITQIDLPDGQDERIERSYAGAEKCGGHRHLPPDRPGCGAPRAGAAHRQRLCPV